LRLEAHDSSLIWDAGAPKMEDQRGTTQAWKRTVMRETSERKIQGGGLQVRIDCWEELNLRATRRDYTDLQAQELTMTYCRIVIELSISYGQALKKWCLCLIVGRRRR
jgi:hypothetical protein